MCDAWKAPPGYFEDPKNVKAVFETIYSRGIWGGGSGRGSDPEVVQPYMDFLQDFLNRNPVRSVVDIGCGDWQFSQFIDWGERSYRGIDVVAEVIRENNARFATPTISFECVNPLDAGFEAGGDLLLMKDVLQHLSNDNVLRLLALTKRFRFSLITNAFGRENADCENGDTRPLDIRAAPFNLAQAVLAGTFHEKAVFVVTNPA